MNDAYADETASFWDAVQGRCALLTTGLAPEQVVYSQGFTLHQLMHAVEVMDPTMDAGMAYPTALLDVRDRTASTFVERDVLTIEELCFVLDRLFAAALAWMHGAALAQTLYTCVYYHRYVVPGTCASAHWTHEVLYAYLLAQAHCYALQWHELMRQHVLDTEDFCGDLGGLGLPDPAETPSALAQLDAALQRVRAAGTEAAPLRPRLVFLRHWLACLAAIGQAVPDKMAAACALEACLHAWKELAPSTNETRLRDPHLADAPQAVQGYFDVTLSRKFTSHIPFRPLALQDAAQVWEGWGAFLRTDMRLLIRIMASDEPLAWLTLLSHTALAFAHHAVVPYVRSCAQTLISDGRTAASGTRDLEHVALAALDALSGASMEDVLVRLEWAQQRDPVLAVATRMRRFVQRMAGLLVQLLSTLAMNRARQKRMLAKAYPAWADLADDAAQLGEAVATALAPRPWDPHLLARAVHFFVLFQQMHTVGAGFDLELYAEHERAAQYYLLKITFEEQHAVCADLITRSNAAPYAAPSLQRWGALAQAQAHLCSVYAMRSLYQYGERGLVPSFEAYAEAAFARRLKWLRRPAWSPPATFCYAPPSTHPHPIQALWDAWRAWARALLAPEADRRGALRAHLAACARQLCVAQEVHTDRWTALCPHESIAAVRDLEHVCAHLRTDVVQDGPPTRPAAHLQGGHPWFPL